MQTAEFSGEGVEANAAEPADDAHSDEQEAEHDPVTASDGSGKSLGDGILQPEIIGAGAAAAAVAAAAAGVSSALHSKPETKPETITAADSSSAQMLDKSHLDGAPAVHQQSESCKHPFSFTLHCHSLRLWDTDLTFIAPAVDREAPTQKLDQSPPNNSATVATKPNTTIEAPENAEPAPESSSNARDQLNPDSTGNANEEEARPTSQNRSVAAVSLNSPSDNWLKAFLRTVFVGFFGTIFSPFRRRSGKAGQ